MKMKNCIDSKGIPPVLGRGNTLTIYTVEGMFQTKLFITEIYKPYTGIYTSGMVPTI